MLKVYSARFGEQEVDDDKVITLPDGMVGFREQHYVLLSPPGGGPFCWFQAVDNPDLAFVVVELTQFVADYRLRITRDECDRLQLGPDNEYVLLAVVTMSSEPGSITINLQGPVVLNPANMRAKQLVMDDSYPSRFPLFPSDAVDGSTKVAGYTSLHNDLATALIGRS